jgi:Thioesterase-like superfamily
MRSPELPLDELFDVPALVGGRATIDVPDRWQQGRGAFGGLVTGIAIRALEHVAPDRPLRSLTAELCGPLQPGPTDVVVETLRAGNAVTTAAVRLVQHGEVQAHAVGVLGKHRLDATATLIARPANLARSWHDVPITPLAAFAPTFAEHAEMRVLGPLPFTGAREPKLEAWIRWNRACTRCDAAFLAACCDSYWPARYSIEPAPRPMATIAFTFQPLAMPASTDEPIFYRAAMLAEDAGYCVEQRELWSAAGQLLALNQQTFVIIK